MDARGWGEEGGTPIERLLSLESHKCRCARRDQWANLSKFERASEGLSGKTDGGEKETERGEKFFSERRLSRCLALIPLSPFV